MMAATHWNEDEICGRNSNPEVRDIKLEEFTRYWKCKLENRSKCDLVALGCTESLGALHSVLPHIPAGTTGSFVWVKTRGTTTGASGVVHYRVGSQIFNIMASVPYDWNLYGAWCNVGLRGGKESFENLYYGSGGCAYPTKAGNWGHVDSCDFFLTNKSQATLTVVYNG